MLVKGLKTKDNLCKRGLNKETTYAMIMFMVLKEIPKRTPTAEDLETEELFALALKEDVDPIADRLSLSAEQLQSLILRDHEAYELIDVIRAEFEYMAQLRLTLLIPDALDALQDITRGGGSKDTAMAQVRAAEAIMDRSIMPRQSKSTQTRIVKHEGNRLPSLNDVIKQAETPEEAMALTERFETLMREIDDIRRGATQTIDVRPEIQTE